MKRTVLVLCALAALGACDDSMSSGASLTREEAIALLPLVLVPVHATADTVITLGPLGSSGTVSFSDELSVTCDPSGTTSVTFAGTIQFDDQTFETSFDIDASARPADCAYRTDNGGIVRISGDPALDINLEITARPEALTHLVAAERGAFRWRRGNAEGRCAVDIAARLNAGSGLVTVTGTFCGFPLSETFPLQG